MKFKMKSGQEVEIRGLKENEDVFALCEFINELVEEDAPIAMDEKMTPEKEAEWLQGQCKKLAQGTLIHLLVLDNKKVVGGCQGEKGHWKESNTVTLGIALRKDYRRQGLGSAMLKELLRQVEEKWEPQCIYLWRHGNNEPARLLYKSLGLKEVGRIPKCIKERGEYVDKVFMVVGDSPCLK